MFTKRIAHARGELTLAEGLGDFVRFRLVTDGHHGQRNVAPGYAELLSRLVRDKAPHLVSHQPQRRRLQAQGQRRGTGVIGAEVIFRTSLGQDGVATNDDQYRRTLAPQLVLLQQAVEGALPGLVVATPVTDDVTP